MVNGPRKYIPGIRGRGRQVEQAQQQPTPGRGQGQLQNATLLWQRVVAQPARHQNHQVDMIQEDVNPRSATSVIANN